MTDPWVPSSKWLERCGHVTRYGSTCALTVGHSGFHAAISSFTPHVKVTVPDAVELPDIPPGPIEYHAHAAGWQSDSACLVAKMLFDFAFWADGTTGRDSPVSARYVRDLLDQWLDAFHGGSCCAWRAAERIR